MKKIKLFCAIMICITISVQHTLAQTLVSGAGWKTLTTAPPLIGGLNWTQVGYNEAGWGTSVDHNAFTVANNCQYNNAQTLPTMWIDNLNAQTTAGQGSNNNGLVYFRQQIILNSDDITGGSIVFSADDQMQIYINGTEITAGPTSGGAGSTLNITPTNTYHLTCGVNEIAISAQNTQGICWFVSFNMVVTTVCPPGLSCTTGNILPKVNSANTNDLICSQIFDDGTKVGINTTTPATKLDVNGQALWLHGGDNGFLPATAGAGINLHYDATGGFGSIFAYDYSGAGAPKPLVLQQGGNSVGIGTSGTINDKLDVNGTVRVQSLPATASSGIVLYGSGPSPTFQSNQLHSLAFPSSNQATSVLLGNGTWGALSTGTVTSSCTTANFVPMWSSTTNQLACSMIQQSSSLANCTTGTHSGIGIGGVPIATGISGSTCYNLALTVYGSGLASGGLWIASDRKFKNNIQPIPSALSSILNLNGVSYNFKSDEYKDMNFPTGKTLGFIAQDLEKFIPEAVMKTDQDFLAVNYTALIPVLTEAIKELNTKVEQTQKENAELKAQIAELCNGGCTGFKSNSSNDQNANQLLQNVPNPFARQTTIGYVLNTGNTAFMNINGLDGKQIKHIELAVKGAGSITVNASEMAPGTYTYSLIVDGKVVDTKLMVISAQE